MQDKNQFIEQLSEKVHDAWYNEKQHQGFHSPQDCPDNPRECPEGQKNYEEYIKFRKHCDKCHTDLYPYGELPDHIQDYDRVTVKAVITALWESLAK